MASLPPPIHDPKPPRDPQAIIRAGLGESGLLVMGTTYPGDLPADIAPWYCYTIDGGHSLYVAIQETFYKLVGERPTQDSAELAVAAMAPVPVKAALRKGYTFKYGLPFCDLPYDDELGVVIEDPDDEEY